MKVSVRRLIVLILSSLSIVSSLAADEVESLKELSEFLKGDPIIEKGIDGKLTQLPKDTPELIRDGVAVYYQHCAACHGAKLEGQENWHRRLPSGLLPAPPHDENGHTWHHADDQLFEVVKYGPVIAMGDPDYRSAMPAYQKVLSDEEILAVLVYIRSTWPAAIRHLQAGTNEAMSGG